jgi:hypothetical protein
MGLFFINANFWINDKCTYYLMRIFSFGYIENITILYKLSDIDSLKTLKKIFKYTLLDKTTF